jgi:hypothetical protein
VRVKAITIRGKDAQWLRTTFAKRRDPSQEARAKAADTLRGAELGTARAHAINKADLDAQVVAIQRLNAKVERLAAEQPIDRAVAFAHGGTFLMDQLAAIDNLAEDKIVRVGKGPVEGQHHAHQREELTRTVDELAKQKPDAHVLVVETYISGSSAIGMTADSVKPLLNKHPNVRITLVLLQETMGRTIMGRPHNVDMRIREKAEIPNEGPGSRLRILSANVPVIIGEDIDAIRVAQSPPIRNPVIVYEPVGAGFVGDKITPVGDATTRQLVIELLRGRRYK